MGDSDPRERYVSLISLEKSHVILTPPIIFLFGGSIIDSPPKSVRGVLYNHILVKHRDLSRSLVIPEDFKDWLHDSVYPDLLSFESDLAQTSSLVIIALESAGAIAELGSFSVNDQLRNKLIILISNYHHNQESFIKLGPLRQLPEDNVFSYPYDDGNVGSSLDEFLDDIITNIKVYLNKINKSELFNTRSNGHVAMLVYDLILIFKALKLKELQSYLKLLSVERDTVEIKRLIFLLTKLDLIEKKRFGNVDFFLPREKAPRIKFSSVDKNNLFDRSAAIIGTAAYYAYSDKEMMRKRAIGHK